MESHDFIGNGRRRDAHRTGGPSRVWYFRLMTASGARARGLEVPADLGRPMRRTLRFSGLMLTVFVVLPVVFHRGLEPRRVTLWALSIAAFAVCLWASAGAPARGRRALLLLAEVGAVAVSVWVMGHGFEGILLALVAMQLGEVVGWTVGAAIVTLQTILLAAVVATTRSPMAAFLLAPPYLGLQLLAFAVVRLLVQQMRDSAELLAARAIADENGRLAERIQIARDLHDAVGHRMTALRLHLEAAARTAEGETRAACQTAHALAGEALSDIRAAVARLREDDGVDLAVGLREIAAQLPPPLRVHLALAPALKCQDGARALALLRCTQEIVTNAARHSRASNLWIDIQQHDGIIEVSARDDGQGSVALVLGTGLRGMRERLEEIGGHLELSTAAGAGFTVRARLPVERA